MSNNVPASAKKLAIKAELLRHLETANKMLDEGKNSSYVKVATLEVAINLLDRGGFEPDLEAWRVYLRPE